MASADTDFHTRDLFENIAAGNHPRWTLKVQLMPFDDAVSYRFNPFDLTKVWPHGDYPLIEVGKMTLHTNPVDHHTQIEQAAFEPNNVVPGIGFSPDRMLLGRVFSYADAHRHRLGGNYKQIPVNAPKNEVHSYSKDGAMRIHNVTDPVYAPNSKGGPSALYPGQGEPQWAANGEILRSAYVDHPEDDDWGQAGTLVREVFDDDARERFVDNVVGHLLNGVSEPVLQRAFEYWHRVDPDIGARIKSGVTEKKDESDPKKDDQATRHGRRRRRRRRPKRLDAQRHCSLATSDSARRSLRCEERQRHPPLAP